MDFDNLFDDLAANAPDEAMERADLKPNLWYIGKTATAENGGLAAKVRSGESEKGKWYRFEVGILAQGAQTDKDGLMVPQNCAGRAAFYGSFIQPLPPRGDEPAKPVATQFAALLNTIFSAGVGPEITSADKGEDRQEKIERRRDERWANTVKCLREAAEEAEGFGITPEAYDGDMARYLAGVTVNYLQNNSAFLLFKTKEDKYKDNVKIVVSTVEDWSRANAANRSVQPFPSFADDLPVFADEGGLEI